MLKKMFEMQMRLQKLIAKKNNIDEPELPCDNPAKFEKNMFSIMVELGEVAKEDERWKDWKNNPNLDEDKKLEEIVDVLHFFINICLYSNITAEMLIEAYQAKYAINVLRAMSDY